MRILKYPMQRGETFALVPTQAVIVHVDFQGSTPVVWAKVDAVDELFPPARKVHFFVTGQEFSEDLIFVGTLTQPGFVLHAFAEQM